MVKVYIEGIGTVTATLIQRYLNGDVRVSYNGCVYIATEVA